MIQMEDTSSFLILCFSSVFPDFSSAAADCDKTAQKSIQLSLHSSEAQALLPTWFGWKTPVKYESNVSVNSRLRKAILPLYSALMGVHL